MTAMDETIITRWEKVQLSFYATVTLAFGTFISNNWYQSTTYDRLRCIQEQGMADECFTWYPEFADKLTNILISLSLIAGALTIILFISWLITAGEGSYHKRFDE